MSSKLDKEAILKKHGIYPGFKSTYGYEEIKAAMESYSASQNEELRKEKDAAWKIANALQKSIDNITKCLPKDFHPDISLPARIMNLWQYYEANENKLKNNNHGT